MNYRVDIDAGTALLLIGSSVQAYNAFDRSSPSAFQRDRVTPPDGYEVVESWTGVDSLFGHDKTVECYGIVLRSLTAPYAYVFAFRGTDSPEDLLDDFGIDKTAFVPYAASATVSAHVEVEEGFATVYRERSGGTESMQSQLFSLLRKYQASDRPIEQLYITGHSLGSALSQLFTLDLALGMPEITALNYNFACPRVGNAAFVKLYQRQAAQQNAATRTIRIQNTFDRVPCVPPESLGYHHTPDAYLIAFYRDSWIDPKFIVDNHSAVHYQAVLRSAFSAPDGYCVDDTLAVPGKDITLISKRPDDTHVCSYW
jgi:hypothetical protein